MVTPGTVLTHELPAQTEFVNRVVFALPLENVEGTATLTVEALVLVPQDVELKVTSISLYGYESVRFVLADSSEPSTWQTISVTVHLPEETSRAVINLNITYRAAVAAQFYSTNWKIITEKARKIYTPSSIENLVAVSDYIRVTDDKIPNIDVPVIPIIFGQTNIPDFTIEEHPIAGSGWINTKIERENIRCYELRNAVIHGSQGLLTVGDQLIFESIELMSYDTYVARWEADGRLSIGLPRSANNFIRVPFGSFHFYGFPGTCNYAHWMLDILPGLHHASLVAPERCQKLLPAPKFSWQEESIDLLSLRDYSVFINESTTVFCDKLYISGLSFLNHGVYPHPYRMSLVKELKDSANVDKSKKRKIYISRKDTNARVLLNEDAVISLVSRFGFEILTLSGMPLREQIKCFAEAEMVIGAHGAGMSNVLFCEPRTIFFELLVDSYVQWSMRRVASLVPLRYGCIIGHEEAGGSTQQNKTWKIDLEQFETALKSALALLNE